MRYIKVSIVSLMTMVVMLVVLNYRTSIQAKEMQEADFRQRCEKECLPNTVYSSKYRCECDVSIVVKDVQ
jgi:hypothetical protein